MEALYAIVGLLALGVALALAAAAWQNRDVMRDLRRADRPPARLLRDALVVWSPLALLIVLLAVAANRLHAGAVALVYRYTTIDEFCEIGVMYINGVEAGSYVPCTGMGGVIEAKAQRAAGAQADLKAYVAEAFRTNRLQVLFAPAKELPKASNSASPREVLRLPAAPEDDPVLASMKRELRELVRTPPVPPRDMLDTIRFMGERDLHTARLRDLTAKVKARRAEVNERAYAGLPSREQGILWLKHRIAHQLEPVTSRPDAATQAALDRIASDPLAPPDVVEKARRGIVLMLARNEAATLSVLSRQTGDRRSEAGLRLALPRMHRWCTLAADEPGLRQRTADFAEGDWASADPSTWTQSNGGLIECIDFGGKPDVHLDRSSFERSVELSIDRWFHEIQADSFSRLGQLSLEAGRAPAATEESARRFAAALPAPMRLGRAQCDWLHPANCAANAARSAAETGLASAQQQAVAAGSQAAGDLATGASASLDARIASLLVGLDVQLWRLGRDADTASHRWFFLHDLLRLLGWLTLALLAVKSFLFVLSLETYHHEGELSVGFDGGSIVEGDYRVARRVTIDPSFPHALVTRQQLSNADNDVRLAPWPWSAPLARILHRRYLLFTRSRFLADAPAGEGGARGMVASASGGMSIVEWRLAPGEEVIFRYQDFFGASENVRLSTRISLRLSTLLLGRIFFRIASAPAGEGRLLLKANVEENELGDIRALPPERMLAWDRHVRFAVHSARTPWKTLLNGYTLVRKDRPGLPPGRIVVSSEETGSNLGTLRFVKRMLSALF